MLIAAVVALALGAGLARAQLVITDPAVTLRDAVIAVLKGQLLGTLTQEAGRVWRMATRSERGDESGEVRRDGSRRADVADPRVFRGDEFLYANPYNAALNYGDATGTAYEEVARPRQAPGRN